MADPFSVAGSAVGVVSLGISVCQGLVNFYSAFKGQDHEVDEMVGKVDRLTDLLETLQYHLSSLRCKHSVSVKNVEQNIVACATALKKLDEILSKCTEEFPVEDLRHKLRAISRRVLYPFKQKTLQDLSTAVSQCQSNLTTAMHILQIDQLTTVESSNAVILKNTTTTRNIIEVHSQEIMAMREDIQRLMEVAVPALVLSSIRPQVQGNAGNTAATALDVSLARPKPQASGERTIMGPESYLPQCGCRARTKFIERQLRLGPVTLIRTSKSRVKHNEDCQYFVPGGQDQGAGLRFQVGTRSRRWNITAALNFNHAVGAFSINPTLVFKATAPDDHPLFLITEEIVVGKRDIEAGLQSIRLLFQNGEATPNDVNVKGANVLVVALEPVFAKIYRDSAVDKAFQARFQQLIMAFLALGVNVNEMMEGWHILDFYFAALFQSLDLGDNYSFLCDPRKYIAMHRDCDRDPGDLVKLVEEETPRSLVESHEVIAVMKGREYLADGFNNLCLAVLRKSLGDVESILSKSPSAISSRTSFRHTVLHLAADWPTGVATLLSRGGRSLVHALDSAGTSPLDHACHNNCAAVVKRLLQEDSRIDPEFIYYLEEQSKWELFRIFVEDLRRRRNLLGHLAKTELPVDRYRDLDIPAEHPMNDIKTVVLLAELEKNFIQIPQTLGYYGITEVSERRWVNFFGSSFGGTAVAANIMHDAGFVLEPNVSLYQEVQLQLDGQCVRFHGVYWSPRSTLAQRLDNVLWVLERGLAFSDLDLHHLFSPSYRSLWLQEGTMDLISLHRDRIDLLSQLLGSRSGRQHSCPCCIDVCFPVLSALRTEGKAHCHDIDDPEAANFIFADLLSLVKACEIDFGSQYWVWAMPRLIHSVLYEVCRLTHSNDCCKREWKLDEDEIKERQEEEQYTRSRLSTLTEELTAEYLESNILLSDFLPDRVVIRALELVNGEEEASSQDRQRLREVGVVLEDERDGDGIANDNIL